MSVPLRTAGGYSLLVILAPLRRIGANAETSRHYKNSEAQSTFMVSHFRNGFVDAV